jgi:hypothetical protein
MTATLAAELEECLAMYERIAPPHLRRWSGVSAEVVKGAGMRAWRQPADGRAEMNDA